MKRKTIAILCITLLLAFLAVSLEMRAESANLWVHEDIWSEESQLTFGSSKDYWPSIAGDSAGTLYLTFVSDLLGEWGLYISNSSNNGVNWAWPTFILKEDITLYGHNIQRMSLLIDSTERIWLAWMSSGGPGKAMIWYVTSEDGGNTWSNPKKPYEGPAPWSGYGDPFVVEAFGKIWIFFGWNSQILSVSTSDGGNTWSPVQEVTPTPPNIETQGTFHPAVILLNGELWLTYSKRFAGAEHDIYLIKSEDGISWSPEQRVASLPGFEFHPTIIEISGKIYVFFIYSNSTSLQSPSIQYTYSTDDGTSWVDYKTLTPSLSGFFGERNTQLSSTIVNNALWIVYSNNYKIRYKALYVEEETAEEVDDFRLLVMTSTIAASILAIFLATLALLRRRNKSIHNKTYAAKADKIHNLFF